MTSAIVARHDQKNAIPHFHLRSSRHDGCWIAGAKGFFNRRDERAGIQQAVDIGFGENVHDRNLGSILREVVGCLIPVRKKCRFLQPADKWPLRMVPQGTVGRIPETEFDVRTQRPLQVRYFGS